MSLRWAPRSPKVEAVITGTGRCGTKYVSKALTDLGVPTGHEAVFTPWGISPDDRWKIDASWMAVPELEYPPVLKGGKVVPIVHLVRHPEDVISSLLGIEFFSNPVHGPYQAFARKHCEGLTGVDEVDAPRFYWQWCEKADKVSDLGVQIEELGSGNFFQFVAMKLGFEISIDEIEQVLGETDKTLNSRERAAFCIDDIEDSHDRSKVQECLVRYRYDS